MRFAWLRKNSASDGSDIQGFSLTLTVIRVAYNAAFFIFLVPFFTKIDYGIGFVILTVIILVRLGANLYANNVIRHKTEQFESFPLRA